MSFYSDFLELVENDTKILRKIASLPPGQVKIKVDDFRHAVEEHSPFVVIANAMREAKIVRVGSQQSQVFMDTPLLPGQDYATWFRLPFPSLYIQLDHPIQFKDYVSKSLGRLRAHAEEVSNPVERERLLQLARAEEGPLIRGMVVSEIVGPDIERLIIEMRPFARWCQEAGVSSDAVLRVISIAFLMPIPGFDLNMHGLTIAVTKQGIVTRPENAPGASPFHVQDAITRWCVHLVNFMSSPSVKLVPREPTKELQKARQKRGKPPLPGWYEIVWRKTIQEYTRDKFSEKKWEHSYRYDVRAHQRIYHKGPMAGRVVWVKSHQRGLKHELYRPAVRSIQGT